MTDDPLVSIVVPTYESGEYLRACLQSIARQTYDPIEVVVVDNDSTDRTREIARSHADRVYAAGPGRSAQVNVGFENARGAYLYRVDSDVVLERDVVRQAVETCENGADAVCVHNTSDPTVSFWSSVRKLERDCYRGDLSNSAARFADAEAIAAVGGYDERLVACEDYDLHNRLRDAGYRIETIDAEEVHLGEPESLMDVLTTHFYYGKTIAEFVERNPERGRDQLRFVRPAYRRNWRRFLANPRLGVGFLVYQLSRYLAAGAGLAVSKLAGTVDSERLSEVPETAGDRS